MGIYKQVNFESISSLAVEYFSKPISERTPIERERFLTKSFPLVKMHVKQIAREKSLPNSVNLDDLRGYGSLGLIRLVDTCDFDPKRSSFVTFASTYIRGSIFDGLRSEDSVPHYVRMACKFLNKRLNQNSLVLSLEEFRNTVNKSKKLSKSAKRVLKKITEETYSVISQYYKDPVFLRTFTDLEDESGFRSQRQDGGRSSRKNELLETIMADDGFFYLGKFLTKTEREIIKMRYYDELTFPEIGKFMKVSESRVAKVHHGIIERLRKEFSGKRD